MSMRVRLGQVGITPPALAVLQEVGVHPLLLLSRHYTGDWGALDPEDWAANDFALRTGDLRILSSYPVGRHVVWIITEADRSSTCILLPEEY